MKSIKYYGETIGDPIRAWDDLTETGALTDLTLAIEDRGDMLVDVFAQKTTTILRYYLQVHIIHKKKEN